ncbi:MAG: substrate-binding domain-containing protein [Opitutaceae bacterium]
MKLLEIDLRAARWPDRLPSQRELCEGFVISRTTLRAALQELARKGLLKLGQGRLPTVRARRRPVSSDPAIRTVILLLPEPVWSLRPSIARWISELAPLLQRSGLELVLREGRLPYRSAPAVQLEKLALSHPRAAWVIFNSTLAMQTWFAAGGLPVVLVGPVFAGINLPSIEYDHAAIAQHAAAQLAAAGHEHMAILLQRTGSAADATTCDAFTASRRAGAAPPLLLEHDGSLAQIHSRLIRLMRVTPRPTALFITKSLSLPAVLTILPRLGMEIPRDLSVICREDDTFAEYLVPAVARYRSDSSAIARKLAIALARLAAGETLKLTHDRLMPRFVAGQSLGPPAPPR